MRYPNPGCSFGDLATFSCAEKEMSCSVISCSGCGLRFTLAHMAVNLLLWICEQEVNGVSPGSQLRVASCGEAVSLTVAYTALDNIMKHYIDFNARQEVDGERGLTLAHCDNVDLNSPRLTQ